LERCNLFLKIMIFITISYVNCFLVSKTVCWDPLLSILKLCTLAHRRKISNCLQPRLSPFHHANTCKYYNSTNWHSSGLLCQYSVQYHLTCTFSGSFFFSWFTFKHGSSDSSPQSNIVHHWSIHGTHITKLSEAFSLCILTLHCEY
jgi:hypothetical protein